VETFEELLFAAVNVTHQDVEAVIARRTSLVINLMAQCRTTSGYLSFERLLEHVSQH